MNTAPACICSQSYTHTDTPSHTSVDIHWASHTHKHTHAHKASSVRCPKSPADGPNCVSCPALTTKGNNTQPNVTAVNHTHSLERQSCVLYVCMCMCMERGERGWEQKTWANSCGLWNYLSFSLSLSLFFCLSVFPSRPLVHPKALVTSEAALHRLFLSCFQLFLPSLKIIFMSLHWVTGWCDRQWHVCAEGRMKSR